jgi:hypothetical protein
MIFQVLVGRRAQNTFLIWLWAVHSLPINGLSGEFEQRSKIPLPYRGICPEQSKRAGSSKPLLKKGGFPGWWGRFDTNGGDVEGRTTHRIILPPPWQVIDRNQQTAHLYTLTRYPPFPLIRCLKLLQKLESITTPSKTHHPLVPRQYERSFPPHVDQHEARQSCKISNRYST